MTKSISYASWIATKDVLIKEYEEEERRRREEALKKIEEETKVAADSEKTADAPSSGSQLVVVDESAEATEDMEKTSPAPALVVVPSEDKEESV